MIGLASGSGPGLWLSQRKCACVFPETNPVGKTLPTTNMSCGEKLGWRLGWLKSLVVRVVLSLVRSFVYMSEAPLESSRCGRLTSTPQSWAERPCRGGPGTGSLSLRSCCGRRIWEGGWGLGDWWWDHLTSYLSSQSENTWNKILK